MGTNDTCFTCQGGSFSHQKGSQDCLSYDTLVYNGEGAKGWIPGPDGAVFCSQKPVPAWNDYYLQGGCCAEVQALQEQLDSEHAFALLVVGVFFGFGVLFFHLLEEVVVSNRWSINYSSEIME